MSGSENLPKQPIQYVSSACDCDKLCNDVSDCEYWAYEHSSGHCYLKKNFERVEENNDYTSGRKGNCETYSNTYNKSHNLNLEIIGR